jgi:uncharacterized protein YjiS (DUF1127 family)
MDNVAERPDFSLPRDSLAPWARLLEQAGRIILRVLQWHAQARRKQATLNELGSLSERALADIGLTRADLDLMGAPMSDAWLEHRDRALYL